MNFTNTEGKICLEFVKPQPSSEANCFTMKLLKERLNRNLQLPNLQPQDAQKFNSVHSMSQSYTCVYTLVFAPGTKRNDVQCQKLIASKCSSNPNLSFTECVLDMAQSPACVRPITLHCLACGVR